MNPYAQPRTAWQDACVREGRARWLARARVAPYANGQTATYTVQLSAECHDATLGDMDTFRASGVRDGSAGAAAFARDFGPLRAAGKNVYECDVPHAHYAARHPLRMSVDAPCVAELCAALAAAALLLGVAAALTHGAAAP